MALDKEDIDQEYDFVGVQKRHTELLRALRQLKIETPSDNGLKDAIDNLSNRLSNMPKPEKPIVNITNNNEEVATIVNHILSAMEKQNNFEPEKRPTEWFHKINRDNNGMIESITSKAKL